MSQTATIAKQMKSILDQADRENRDLTDSELRQLEGLRARGSTSLDENSGTDPRLRGGMIPHSPESSSWGNQKRASTEWVDDDAVESKPDPATGNPIHILGPRQEMRSTIPEPQAGPERELLGKSPDIVLGNILRGMATGNWVGAEAECRSLSTSSGSGSLVPSQLAAWAIDYARAKSVCIDAGAQTIPMESKNLVVPKIISDPTCYWRAEGSAITPSEPGIAGVTLEAKTLACLFGLSIELLEDSPLAGQVAANTLLSAIATALDSAALQGTGASYQPTGILNTSGIETIENDDAILTRENILSAFLAVRENNGEPSAMVTSPRGIFNLDSRKDGDGCFMTGPAAYDNLPKFATTAVPTNLGTGTDQTYAVVGDFSKLMIGVRTQIRIEVLNSGTVGATDAAASMLHWFRAYVRADIGVEQPGHFCAITEVGDTSPV